MTVWYFFYDEINIISEKLHKANLQTLGNSL